ncbi:MULTISPECIES: hypothetical protein [unclassified Lysobacter]|uniref:hypothetical protein n=1 Tax=unclassified Lysobacter TaxID=2635362 RepID=UPI001BE83FB0|nr:MULTISPECIES: hypothetical protein [unclassified Lysobacter]MBT2750216.1 hypothetical protein [Lysobacter sp. ISL-50]MBT2775213.1 hypothetical protein [Lysobacter sp. ISL-54]MBT2782586.1 hypothetical protein [Lysobacter sp. ISL-52]
MMLRSAPIAICAAALLAAPATLPAATYRVDDNGTQVSNNSVQMRWDSPLPGGAAGSGVSGALNVALRLNVAAWRGRIARIYMTLPASPSGPLSASWSTQGRLLPGTLRAGERTLVYSGPIGDSALEDHLRLSLQADGQRLVRAEALNFSFEIDLDDL